MFGGHHLFIMIVLILQPEICCWEVPSSGLLVHIFSCLFLKPRCFLRIKTNRTVIIFFVFRVILEKRGRRACNSRIKVTWSKQVKLLAAMLPQNFWIQKPPTLNLMTRQFCIRDQERQVKLEAKWLRFYIQFNAIWVIWIQSRLKRGRHPTASCTCTAADTLHLVCSNETSHRWHMHWKDFIWAV